MPNERSDSEYESQNDNKLLTLLNIKVNKLNKFCRFVKFVSLNKKFVSLFVGVVLFSAHYT